MAPVVPAGLSLASPTFTNPNALFPLPPISTQDVPGYEDRSYSEMDVSCHI